jgi:hypothetical protein
VNIALPGYNFWFYLNECLISEQILKYAKWAERNFAPSPCTYYVLNNPLLMDKQKKKGKVLA